MKARRGIALLLTVGILVMLALGATALLSLAGQLRAGTALQLDQTQARLLARAGIEYASARLFQDSTARSPPTPSNQADDWTYRDGPDIPLERSSNPSYAQSEPYVEMGIPNGRFDAGVEPYVDLDQDGRFDAWSGRLRGRHGAASATFVLKISGENAEGGINVNSGFLSDTDVNGNKIADYCDLGGTDGWSPSTANLLNDTLALAFRSTPMYDYGSFQSLTWNKRIASVINELGLLLGIASSRPGDAIVRNRPLGGYRSLQEAADRCGFLPVDWDRLRKHLSIRSARNGNASLSEARYLLNVSAAAPEAIAAAFSGMKAVPPGPPLGFIPREITPAEALRVAGFLKTGSFASRYDLYLQLQASRDALFLPVTLEPDPYDTNSPQGLAALVHALAIPEELWLYSHLSPGDGNGGPHVFPTPYDSWVSYDEPFGKGDLYGSSIGRKDRCFSSNREMNTIGSIELDTGPVSLFFLASLGRVGSGVKGEASIRRASGLFQDGNLRIDNQHDLENLSRFSRFDGGWAMGRPIRDRAATYPCFSRDACPELAVHPLTDQSTPNCFDEFRYEFGYCHYQGEVMLADRSWLDEACSFYQPNWDLDQPERPQQDQNHPSLDRNFDDVAGGIGCTLSSAAQPALGTGTLRETHASFDFTRPGPQNNYLVPARDSLECHFEWPIGNDSPFGDFHGDVEGTVEYWGTWTGVWHVNPGSTDRDAVHGDCRHWQHTRGPFTDDLSNQSPPQHAPCHVAYTFSAADGGPSDGVNAYVDGIRWGGFPYDPWASDPNYPVTLSNVNLDELRIYREAFPSDVIRSHVLKGYYWMLDPAVQGQQAPPSFISPLYAFDEATKLTGASWDGFVPKVIREATDEWGRNNPGAPKRPLSVELLIFDNPADPTPVKRIPLPDDGHWISFQDRPVSARYLRYKVSMDISALDRAWRTPVFDAIRIGYKLGRLTNLSEE